MKEGRSLTRKEKEALLKVTRPSCFGQFNCPQRRVPCEHESTCEKRWRDKHWMQQAILKVAEHERKAKYFEKRIKELTERGIPLS